MDVSATLSAAEGVAPATPPVVSKRHVAAAVVGNALEFYDFTTYAFFAAQIGRAFFPSQNPINGLEASLAIFGAGFFTRPLGALVIGSIGDRVGRRPAMLLSFALMGVAILGLALCPSYAQIGPAAPVLVILIRLVQGFALGGEVGPTTAFLLEAAPPHRRAVYTGLQSVSQNIASLTAGVVGFTLASLLTTSQIDLFGWRIAFLIGAVVLPFGLIIRRTLPETLHHAEPQPHAKTGAAPTQLRVILCSIAILAGGTVATYIQGYLTTYCGSILHMKLTAAFSATIVYGANGNRGQRQRRAAGRPVRPASGHGGAAGAVVRYHPPGLLAAQPQPRRRHPGPDHASDHRLRLD